MNAKEISMKHATLLAAIAVGLAGKVEAGKASAEASGTVSQALRDYSKATADEDGAEAAKALGIELAYAEVKAGTIKASLNHYKGFRAMVAAGINIDTGKEGKPFTVADAQAYIASDDVKRVKAIRTAISKVVQEAGKTKEGDSTDDNRETRLVIIAEALGADLKEYRALLDTLGHDEEANGNDGEQDGEDQVQAA